MLSVMGRPTVVKLISTAQQRGQLKCCQILEPSVQHNDAQLMSKQKLFIAQLMHSSLYKDMTRKFCSMLC